MWASFFRQGHNVMSADHMGAFALRWSALRWSALRWTCMCSKKGKKRRHMSAPHRCGHSCGRKDPYGLRKVPHRCGAPVCPLFVVYDHSCLGHIRSVFMYDIMHIVITARIGLHWLIGYLECGVAHIPGDVPCAVGLYMCAVGRPPAMRSNTEYCTHPVPNTARPIPHTAVLNTECCANTEAIPHPIWAECRTECCGIGPIAGIYTCGGPTASSAHRNPPMHIPDFEKRQLFYLRPDLPHFWLFPAHS